MWSKRSILTEGPEGQIATGRPLVVKAPVILWGRDSGEPDQKSLPTHRITPPHQHMEIGWSHLGGTVASGRSQSKGRSSCLRAIQYQPLALEHPCLCH